MVPVHMEQVIWHKRPLTGPRLAATYVLATRKGSQDSAAYLLALRILILGLPGIQHRLR